MIPSASSLVVRRKDGENQSPHLPLERQLAVTLHLFRVELLLVARNTFSVTARRCVSMLLALSPVQTV